LGKSSKFDLLGWLSVGALFSLLYYECGLQDIQD